VENDLSPRVGRYSNIYDAITIEKQTKKWKRQWKIELTEKDNPGCKNPYLDTID